MPLLGKSQGVRRYVEEMLRALPRAGVDLHHPSPSRHMLRALGLPKIGFGLRHGYELAGLPAARTSDLVHYTDTYGPLRSSTPIVVTVHDTTFLTHPELHDGSVVRWLSHLAERTWPRVDRFVAVTEVTKQDMVRAGVEASRISVVHHGVDHVLRVTAGGGLPEGLVAGRYFVFLGNLEPRKNLATLLRAFHAAADSLPSDVKLAIAGKFAWGDQPMLELEDLVRSGRVLHLGFVSDSTAVALIKECAAFVYPSSYEGFGLPPLEAQLLGAPVIVGDNPAAREVLGADAVFVEPRSVEALSDALISALSTVGDRGNRIEWASRFTWRRAARQTADVYSEVGFAR